MFYLKEEAVNQPYKAKKNWDRIAAELHKYKNIHFEIKDMFLYPNIPKKKR